MARNYNYIYKQLVEDENDIVGHIAYSLYKAEKIEYINKFKDEYGREPNEDELKPFHESACVSGSLSRYKYAAISLLQTFMSNSISEYSQQIEQVCKEHYIENIKEACSTLHPVSKGRRYWEGIMQSILGAVAFALILAIIAFILKFKGADFNISIKPATPTTEIEITTDNTL